MARYTGPTLRLSRIARRNKFSSMKTIQKINKHFRQIKNGGILVIIKKFKSLIVLFLQVPVYLISIPTIILIRLIRPWFLIRWHGINSARIGHFASETELYCCEIDSGINKPNQNYVDLFYLSKKIVSNKQLERMWRRKIKIFPHFLIYPLFNFNRILDNFFKGICSKPHTALTWFSNC